MLAELRRRRAPTFVHRRPWTRASLKALVTTPEPASDLRPGHRSAAILNPEFGTAPQSPGRWFPPQPLLRGRCWSHKSPGARRAPAARGSEMAPRLGAHDVDDADRLDESPDHLLVAEQDGVDAM